MVWGDFPIFEAGCGRECRAGDLIGVEKRSGGLAHPREGHWKALRGDSKARRG